MDFSFDCIPFALWKESKGDPANQPLMGLYDVLYLIGLPGFVENRLGKEVKSSFSSCTWLPFNSWAMRGSLFFGALGFHEKFPDDSGTGWLSVLAMVWMLGGLSCHAFR